MKYFICVLWMWFLIFPATVDAAVKTSDLMPRTSKILDILGMKWPAEYELLAFKFAASAQKHPEWFRQYAKKYNTYKGRLPYHRNLGLTEEEYARMGTLSDQGEMIVTGHGQIILEKIEDGIEKIRISI